MSEQAILGILVPVAFLVVFPAFWCFVTWIIGAMGWRTIASLYPDRNPPENYPLEGVMGRVGVAQYRGVLMLGVSDAGIHMSVQVLFRVGHPPILVPWHAIESVSAGHAVRWLSTRALALRGTRVRVALREGAFDELVQLSGARWPLR
jgi:hypothetical protein